MNWHNSRGLWGYVSWRCAYGMDGCDDRACVCRCHDTGNAVSNWDPSENCWCGGPEEIYPHRRGTGYYCRRRPAPALPRIVMSDAVPPDTMIEPLNLDAWRQLLRVADVSEYAAACRWAVPALLSELEQTRAEVERLCKVVDRAERNNCGCLGYPIDQDSTELAGRCAPPEETT